MTFEEIIERLDKMAQHHEICGQTFALDFPREKYQKWGHALRAAIALLRTHPDNQPNEPLTLEELRDMCEPVWVSVPGLKSGGYWCLCKNGTIIPPSCNEFRSSDIPNWVFYRRPPKEETS